MDRKLELWVVMKFGELDAGRSLTMDDLAEIESRHPIMIGNIIPLGRIEEPTVRRRVKKISVSKRARRSARRRAARKR